MSDHVTSIDHYTTLQAEQWVEEGRRTNVLEIAVHPPIAFLRNYVLRLGFKDGAAGLLVSALNSYYVFMKLVKLWELQHPPSRTDPRSRFGEAARQTQRPTPSAQLPSSQRPAPR